MTETSSPIPTRIYLLSVWHEQGNNDAEKPVLRFSLEDPRTGERLGFNSPQALAEFFEAGWDDHIGGNVMQGESRRM